MGIALFQMAVFIDTTEAKSRDSDGDGTPDVGKFYCFTILLWVGRYQKFVDKWNWKRTLSWNEVRRETFVCIVREGSFQKPYVKSLNEVGFSIFSKYC